jgi:hypothetical protein
MGDISMGGCGALGPELASIERGNFASIYGDSALRQRFLSFLTNVFHLYPEDRLHALIGSAVRASKDDRAVYQRIERELPEIAPPLGAFRYAQAAIRDGRANLAAARRQDALRRLPRGRLRRPLPKRAR